MNNPDIMPIDIEEQRAWLTGYKASTGMSWAGIEKLSGISQGTLSTFGTNNYQGRNDEVAKRVFRFRQLLDSQAERRAGMIGNPGYFETPTSKRLNALMVIAHMGRITVGATGPGTGKTMATREYSANVTNCFVATMRQTTGRPNAMMAAVLRALGSTRPSGFGAQMSQLIVETLAGRQALLVVDEANHLTLESLEELRGWHDATGVGICLLGNEELLMRIRGGPRRDAFARLNSRIAESHIQNLPLPGDAAAFCDAWGIDEPGMRAMLEKIAMTPGAGGLRELRQIVERGSMLAADEERPLSLADLRDAKSTRATHAVAA